MAGLARISPKGGEADDLIFGQNRNDMIFGGDGKDTIYGGDEDDLIFGNDGNDSLFRGESSDTLNGGTSHNDEVIFGGNSFDLSDDAEFDCEIDILGSLGLSIVLNFQSSNVGSGWDMSASDLADGSAQYSSVTTSGGALVQNVFASRGVSARRLRDRL